MQKNSILRHFDSNDSSQVSYIPKQASHNACMLHLHTCFFLRWANEKSSFSGRLPEKAPCRMNDAS